MENAINFTYGHLCGELYEPMELQTDSEGYAIMEILSFLEDDPDVTCKQTTYNLRINKGDYFEGVVSPCDFYVPMPALIINGNIYIITRQEDERNVCIMRIQ